MANIDKLVVYRGASKTTPDQSETYASIHAFALAALSDATLHTDKLVGTFANSGSDTFAATTPDTGLTAGTYQYAVFPVNGAGIPPSSGSHTSGAFTSITLT